MFGVLRLLCLLRAVDVITGGLVRPGVPLGAVVLAAVVRFVTPGERTEERVGVEAASGRIPVVSDVPGVGVLVVHQLLSRLGSRTWVLGPRGAGDPEGKQWRDCTRRYATATIFGRF